MSACSLKALASSWGQSDSTLHFQGPRFRSLRGSRFKKFEQSSVVDERLNLPPCWPPLLPDWAGADDEEDSRSGAPLRMSESTRGRDLWTGLAVAPPECE